MALTPEDLDAIGQVIDQKVSRAITGGPVVQVAPRDLVFLGNGVYVSESKGLMYKKAPGGRLAEAGPIPDPL